MFTPQSKKSRFWSETQQVQRKTSQQEEHLSVQSDKSPKPVSENNIKSSTKIVPESIRNALFGLTINNDNRKVSPTPTILNHLNKNQNKTNDSSSQDQNSKINRPHDSLSAPTSPKTLSDTPNNDQDQHHHTFKSYRDKFSIRVIPPKSFSSSSIHPLPVPSSDAQQSESVPVVIFQIHIIFILKIIDTNFIIEKF